VLLVSLLFAVVIQIKRAEGVSKRTLAMPNAPLQLLNPPSATLHGRKTLMPIQKNPSSRSL